MPPKLIARPTKGNAAKFALFRLGRKIAKMDVSEKRLSTFLLVCTVTFLLGLFMLVLSMFPGFGFMFGTGVFGAMGIATSLMTISATVGMAGFLAMYLVKKKAVEQSREGPRVRLAAKIHSIWRSDKGRVVGPFDEELEQPGYHVVLVSEDNKRIELQTSEQVFGQCAEGSWGYAEIQGDWLGSYVRDAALYTKHTGR